MTSRRVLLHTDRPSSLRKLICLCVASKKCGRHSRRLGRSARRGKHAKAPRWRDD
ncbi:hypothetical protein PsYK624_132210 [Phanerochaete sordida]|uniref:Uncharacterized protein n=1 Tax=Phanerochaete sordida TaxID=48140 RepID=A0A9P3GL62_9APHY|nr:hypothetical protein PsYK624_132210 [Phanerochaete sordida]